MSGRDLTRPPGAPVPWCVTSRAASELSPPVRTWFEARAWGAVQMQAEPHELCATPLCGPLTEAERARLREPGEIAPRSRAPRNVAWISGPTPPSSDHRSPPVVASPTMTVDLLVRILQLGGYGLFLLYFDRRFRRLDARLHKLITIASPAHRRELRVFVDQRIARALTQRRGRERRSAP